MDSASDWALRVGMVPSILPVGSTTRTSGTRIL